MYWRIGIVALALVAGWTANGWRLGEMVERERAAIAQKVIALEKSAAAQREKLEIEHAETSKKIERTLADNRRLARELGGMRDPGKRAACPLPGAAGSDEDPAASGRLSGASEGLLSDEASEFILELAADADRAAQYAVTCHEWAMRPK